MPAIAGAHADDARRRRYSTSDAANPLKMSTPAASTCWLSHFANRLSEMM